MADTRIDVLGISDLPLITELYNQIFTPRKDAAFFERRLAGRHNPLVLAAEIGGRPIGFFLGMETKPGVYYEWLYGVLADRRRTGIASQLMEAAQAWARDHEYTVTRAECHNQHRPMLQLCIKQGYDIVGVRWDYDRHQNLVIFEKLLNDDAR